MTPDIYIQAAIVAAPLAIVMLVLIWLLYVLTGPHELI